MRIDVLTLFPESVQCFCNYSIVQRAQQRGLVEIVCTDIRQYSQDKHRKVDDKPFGGGPGMIMMCQPVFDAVEAVQGQDDRPATKILLTPQGRKLTQQMVRQLALEPRLLLIAGHYEGFDERIRTGLEPLEISIGDYVLSGGETAAAVLIDAIVRLLPGALGDEQSTTEESFSDGLLEYPQYTRPRVFRGMEVPEILVNGNHGKIAAWQDSGAQRRTAERRPDLLEGNNHKEKEENR